jgi:hypothetical protein
MRLCSCSPSKPTGPLIASAAGDRISQGREEESAIPAEPVWVERTFRGEFRWRTTCQTCASVSIVTEPFYDLSLPIPQPRSPPSATSASQSCLSGAVAGAPASEEEDSGKRMSKGQKKEKLKAEKRAAVKRMEEEAAEAAAVAAGTVAEDARGGRPTVEWANGDEDGTRGLGNCEGAAGSSAEEVRQYL